MAISKVVVIMHGTSKEVIDRVNSITPDGWQAKFIDTDEGEPKIISEMADTEYLVCYGSGVIPIKFVENARKLKLIQAGGQDVGHLPLKWAFEKNIYVANAGGANAIAVSEFTILLMLSCMKHLLQNNQGIRDGKWRSNLNRENRSEIYDKTVGIIGFGNIGRRVASLCYHFGANIIYTEKVFVPHAVRADMKAKPVKLEELLNQSDLVSLHIPSGPGNRAIIGWEQLNMMKPTAYLINTSRGANVDEEALIRALNEKKIAGAGIDVWDPEPPKPDNPLLRMPNVVATPHIASQSWDNRLPAFEAIWRNITMVSEGKEPLNRIRDLQ